MDFLQFYRKYYAIVTDIVNRKSGEYVRNTEG